MKASSATSAKATVHPRPTGRSSDRRPHSPISAEDFALAGPSNLPDARFHAYRPDLADVSLAGRVIASHYAEPAHRLIKTAGPLRANPAMEAEIIGEVEAGDKFEMLDNSLGWAWGYAGTKRLVGYLPSDWVGS